LQVRLAILTLAVAAAALAAADALHAQSRTDAALFTQMATVFEHPRCLNCHTDTGFPRQGDDRHRHTMNVARGPGDRGAPGLHCGTCHQAANQHASGVPGAPGWGLAPLRMTWEGLTPGQICASLFDPSRGGMKPDQLVEHLNTALVRWAWSPGADEHGRARTTPPIAHDAFVELTRRWLAGGAVCPAP